jgi:uncharacterized protein (TIGR02001 family)
MNRSLLAIAAALTVTSLPIWVHAEDAPASPLSFNAGLVTDYRYRGISQSRLKPALQGGADYAAANGLYIGTWASTIKWVKDAGGDGSIEWDIYGGYKGEFSKSLSYDIGLLTYVYPGNKLAVSADTTEVYGALTTGPFTAKYSYAVTNLFGFGDSKGSGYLDLSATFDLGNGYSVAPHIGHQSVANFSPADYTDYSLTLGKDLGNGISLSAAVIGTDASKTGYVTPAGKFTGKNAVVLGAKYTF